MNSSGGAIVSKCNTYRYALWRETGGSMAPVMFIMLNPSTADAERDDPTIRRCIGFARDWGHSHLIVVNLFAYRSTDPKKLTDVKDPVGPMNDEYIRHYRGKCSALIAAWGTLGGLHGRDKWVAGIVNTDWLPLWALGFTKHGHPKHPLYVRRDIKPVRF